MERKFIPFPVAGAIKSPLSAGVEVNGTVYLSGVTAINYETGQVPDADIGEQTHLVFKSIKAVLVSIGLGLEHVVRVHVFLTSQGDVGVMNEIYREYFKEPYPARSTVIAAALARPGFKIEIDITAVR